MTPEQRHAIDCVVAIFETGKVPSAKSYGTCSILNDGAGISYGKHQCTDKAGSLDLVCKKYIELGGQHAEPLKQYMNYIAANESAKFNNVTAENEDVFFSTETSFDSSAVNLASRAALAAWHGGG